MNKEERSDLICQRLNLILKTLKSSSVVKEYNIEADCPGDGNGDIGFLFSFPFVYNDEGGFDFAVIEEPVSGGFRIDHRPCESFAGVVEAIGGDFSEPTDLSPFDFKSMLESIASELKEDLAEEFPQIIKAKTEYVGHQMFFRGELSGQKIEIEIFFDDRFTLVPQNGEEGFCYECRVHKNIIIAKLSEILEKTKKN